MKKPEGKADSGWYDHPEMEGYEKYWSGKFWTKKNRLIGEEGPSVIPADAKYLGRFLFRFPIGGDGAFIAYLVVVGLSLIYEIKQESVGGLNLVAVITSFLV